MDVDLQTRVINALIDHAPLLVGLAAVMRYMFPHLLRQGLTNGAGEIIRSIVKTENAAQSIKHAEAMDHRFEMHEAQEDRRFRIIEDEVFHRRKTDNNPVE